MIQITKAMIPFILPVLFLDRISMIDVTSNAIPQGMPIKGIIEQTKRIHVAAISPVGVFASMTTPPHDGQKVAAFSI